MKNKIINSISNIDDRSIEYILHSEYDFTIDTLCFASKFVNHYRFWDIFDSSKYDLLSVKYFADLFCISLNKAQSCNNLSKVCKFLSYTGVLKEIEKGKYEILELNILEFIASAHENAYIYLYILCYHIISKNSQLLFNYRKYCSTIDINEKQNLYDVLTQSLLRYISTSKEYNKKLSCFIPIFNLLGFANFQNSISEKGKVSNVKVLITDIVANKNGNNVNTELPKKNSYIEEISISYIIENLKIFLVAEAPKYKFIQPLDSFSIDVADTKMDMFDAQDGKIISGKVYGDKYSFVNGVKVRTVQNEFRSGLLKTTPHVCPICGFEFENFLIASHIMPYSKCEDTYDAMNSNNGFLICPICDKLFESANYMTVDYKTGKVIYDDVLDNEKDFKYLKNRQIDKNYIDCERRHYLKWHNEFYHSKH